jgi:hypothetical protein
VWPAARNGETAVGIGKPERVVEDDDLGRHRSIAAPGDDEEDGFAVIDS